MFQGNRLDVFHSGTINRFHNLEDKSKRAEIIASYTIGAVADVYVSIAIASLTSVGEKALY